MFKITEETRAAAIEEMVRILQKEEVEVPEDYILGDMFDAAVDIVKKQFGM